MKLDDDEEISFQLSPDFKLFIPWFFSKTLFYTLGAACFFFILYFLFNILSVLSMDSSELELLAIFEIDYSYRVMGATLLFLITAQTYVTYLKRTYKFTVTNKRCIFEGGILRRVERSIPHKRITDIQRTQNIVERILGMWNVHIFTAGTASIDLRQGKPQAEISYEGLINSEEVMESINRFIQQCD